MYRATNEDLGDEDEIEMRTGVREGKRCHRWPEGHQEERTAKCNKVGNGMLVDLQALSTKCPQESTYVEAPASQLHIATQKCEQVCSQVIANERRRFKNGRIRKHAGLALHRRRAC